MTTLRLPTLESRDRTSRTCCVNKLGGQKGHYVEILRQVAEPDKIIDHYLRACAECGSTLTPAMAIVHLLKTPKGQASLVLLCHKLLRRDGAAIGALQHGHRGRLLTSAPISRRRMVAIEFGM